MAIASTVKMLVKAQDALDQVASYVSVCLDALAAKAAWAAATHAKKSRGCWGTHMTSCSTLSGTFEKPSRRWVRTVANERR